MRVTIEHREQTAGVIGSKKDCYVDCTVEFSEEERAIIKERDLYREGFTVRTSTPVPSSTAFFAIYLGAMRADANLCSALRRTLFFGQSALSQQLSLLEHVSSKFFSLFLAFGRHLDVESLANSSKAAPRISSQDRQSKPSARRMWATA